MTQRPSIKSAHDVVAALGGTMACARYFGCVPSAVSNWLATNRIPDRYHLRLKAQLEARGYDVDVHALGWLSRRDTRPDVECFM